MSDERPDAQLEALPDRRSAALRPQPTPQGFEERMVAAGGTFPSAVGSKGTPAAGKFRRSMQSSRPSQ